MPLAPVVTTLAIDLLVMPIAKWVVVMALSATTQDIFRILITYLLYGLLIRRLVLLRFMVW